MPSVCVLYRRTVRKTAEKGRKKAIRKASPRLLRAAENCTSSDSDSYKLHEITEKSSQEDSTFWGRKPVPSRMRSSSTNSDSSSNDSGSRKGSRENTPELPGDAKKNVTELKELFAKRSLDEQVSVKRSPQVTKKKYSPEDRPAVTARSKPSTISDSPSIPSRPQVFRTQFANAFTTNPNEKKLSPPSSSMGILEEVPSDLEASTRSTVSPTKPKKVAPPTPPRKQSLQNSPTASPEARRRSSSERIETAATESDDNNTALQDKAMEAILKVLLQKNGPELQNLVKQAVASDPELLKMALSNNQ